MSSEALVVGVVFALFAVPASVIDIRSYRVPNVCTVGGTLVVAALRVIVLRNPPLVVVCGTALGCGVFLAARLATRGRLGLGDVKLSALIGVTTLPAGWPMAVALGSAAAVVWAVGVSLGRGVRLRDIRIPYAPFLCAGALASLALAAPLS